MCWGCFVGCFGDVFGDDLRILWGCFWGCVGNVFEILLEYPKDALMGFPNPYPHLRGLWYCLMKRSHAYAPWGIEGDGAGARGEKLRGTGRGKVNAGPRTLGNFSYRASHFPWQANPEGTTFRFFLV